MARLLQAPRGPVSLKRVLTTVTSQQAIHGKLGGGNNNPTSGRIKIKVVK